MNNSLTPDHIHVGQRLICRFASGALLLSQLRWYTVALVFQTPDFGRMVEFDELPGMFYPAWRFMAYEPSRNTYRRAEPVDPQELAAAIRDRPWRRSEDSGREAELARPAAG